MQVMARLLAAAALLVSIGCVRYSAVPPPLVVRPPVSCASAGGRVLFDDTVAFREGDRYKDIGGEQVWLLPGRSAAFAIRSVTWRVGDAPLPVRSLKEVGSIAAPAVTAYVLYKWAGDQLRCDYEGCNPDAASTIQLFGLAASTPWFLSQLLKRDATPRYTPRGGQSHFTIGPFHYDASVQVLYRRMAGRTTAAEARLHLRRTTTAEYEKVLSDARRLFEGGSVSRAAAMLAPYAAYRAADKELEQLLTLCAL